jgi:DNA-binding PadR family transcriptional regulator
MSDRSHNDLIPLTPAAFHILLAVADTDKHGYAIMQEVERLTGGKIKLGPGTLYGALKRFLADGLIAESDERPDPEIDDERRRYYRLTNWGRRVVTAEAERLEAAVLNARAKRLLKGRPSAV